MTPEELEALMVEAFEIGAVFGFALVEDFGDLSMSEVRHRARNKFEAMKEEILNGS